MESSLPGIKFSTSTSALATSLRKISSPSGCLKLTVMERLFLFTARKYADSGGRWEEAFGAISERGAAGGFHEPVLRQLANAGDSGRDTQRVSSPRFISSTFITSAPRSARSIVAVGPARTRVKSRMRIPLSGGSMPAAATFEEKFLRARERERDSPRPSRNIF